MKDTTELFWMTLRRFRDDTLAAQMLIVAAYLGIVFLILRREGKQTDVIVKLLLSAMFLFNGIVCFLLYFSERPLARFFAGPLYMALGYLFLVDILAKRMHFTFRVPPRRRFLAFFFIVLAFLFPVFGMFGGHGMIALPGAPCPLAIFTLALLSAAMPRVDTVIVVMLLAWVLVNVPKVFGYAGCYEEAALVLAGAYVLALNRLPPEGKKSGGGHAAT